MSERGTAAVELPLYLGTAQPSGEPIIFATKWVTAQFLADSDWWSAEEQEEEEEDASPEDGESADLRETVSAYDLLPVRGRYTRLSTSFGRHITISEDIY